MRWSKHGKTDAAYPHRAGDRPNSAVVGLSQRLGLREPRVRRKPGDFGVALERDFLAFGVFSPSNASPNRLKTHY